MAMKLGVSHQTPETLTGERLKYLISMGVESMEVRLDAQDATFDNIMSVKKKVEAAGIELHEIILNDVLESDDVTLGGEYRDERRDKAYDLRLEHGRKGL
jgi:hypothetical protein